MGYSIKVLSNKEFDELPFALVRTSLGVANPKTNEVYIRQTYMPEMSKFLIDHELDHLVEEIPTDEYDGVRYFSLGNIFGGLKNIFSSGLSGLGSALGTTARSVFGGTKSGSGSMSNYSQPSGGRQLLSSAFQSLPYGSPAGGGFNVRSGFPSSQGDSKGGNFLSSLGGGLGGILSAFGPKLLGAGALGLGLMKNYPKVPSLMTPQIQQLQGQIQGGGSPLGQQAQGVVSGNLNKQFSPLTDQEITAATAELDRSKLQDLKRLEGVYASSRPGTDYTTDSNYKQDLDLLERTYASEKANQVANRTRSAEQYFNQNQQANIQSAIGASNEQMRQLAEIAQLDVAQIMAQLSLDAQQAQTFKDTFLQLGTNLLTPQPSIMDFFQPQNK